MLNAYTPVIPISASAAVAVATDSIIIATAATVPVVVTLFDPNGRYGYSVEVINDPASKNIVTVAAGTGSIVGNVTLYPGQSAIFNGDGIASFYNFAPAPSFGTLIATLSTANIIAMYTTPVSVIPSPGANKMIRVVSVTGKVVFNTTAFASGGVFILQYDSTANGAGLNSGSGTIAAAIINGVANQGFTLNGAAYTGGVLTGLANKALYASNQTGVFATGDGSVVLTIDYKIVSV